MRCLVRFARGGAQEGRTKTQWTSTLCQAGRPIVENSLRAAKLESYLRWAPPEVQVETWECRVVSSWWALRDSGSRRRVRSNGAHDAVCWKVQGRLQETARMDTVTSHPKLGVWVFRGALRGKQLLAALVSSVDWFVRGLTALHGR